MCVCVYISNFMIFCYFLIIIFKNFYKNCNHVLVFSLLFKYFNLTCILLFMFYFSFSNYLFIFVLYSVSNNNPAPEFIYLISRVYLSQHLFLSRWTCKWENSQCTLSGVKSGLFLQRDLNLNFAADFKIKREQTCLLLWEHSPEIH